MKHFYKNKRILVTGGGGFIGSHLVDSLVSLGAQVTVLDNFETGSQHNLEQIDDKIETINGTVTCPDTCMQVTRDKKIIFHLAAFISVPASVENPRDCYEINVNGTFNLLEAARHNNVERFVFSSSSAVYGAQKGTTCSEEMECKPLSLYGTSKLIGELLCRQYSQTYGIKTTCLRYFNVFGHRQNPNGEYAAVIAKFKHLMSRNKPITIFGDGFQKRDFIPVEKVVQANLFLGRQNKSIMDGRPFNIATGKGKTILELIKQLKKEFPAYSKKPVFQPARCGDIENSVADINRLQSVEYF